ncbi:ADAMTS-like protein 5 [Diadema setosum]|uniref:ADAMTS-like protein 5 n=1 Tax=Diadema setosum TaxID=31175 RepID=UPI003B3AAA8A
MVIFYDSDSSPRFHSRLTRAEMDKFLRPRGGSLSLFCILLCLLFILSARGEDYEKSDDKPSPGLISVSRTLTLRRHRARRSLTSVWSSWGRWSACSRTCGGGSSFRTRHCMSRIPMRYMTRALACPGSSREYRSCNTKDCPYGALDYRSVQCSVFNLKDSRDRLIREWLPVYNSQGECELVCHTSDGAYMYTFGRVLDGTRCRFTDQDMCIAGKCVKVGCDGELYSNRTLDVCGVCGGRNDTCGYVRKIYTDAYPVRGYHTYSKIASIPAGATNIRIKDRSGLNYIALEDEENNFILNGDWSISWPGDYQAAGTSFRYERGSNGLENVVAAGPLDKPVNVLIIFRERNPGVEFEYFLPPKGKTETEKNSVNYNNEIQMLPFMPGLANSPEKRKFGAIEPRKKPSELFVNDFLMCSRLSSSSTEKCGKCKRVKGRAEHFCRGSFALLVEVVDQSTIGGETRYDVDIEVTFKNNIHLNHREYLWVPNACPCPKLRTGGRYIVTGSRVSSPETGESRLVLEREDMVVKYKPRLRESWDRLQSREQKVCAKYT